MRIILGVDAFEFTQQILLTFGQIDWRFDDHVTM